MKFSGNGHKCKSVFLYNGKPLENVPKYKYLGIEFSSSGLWSSAIANITNRGKKTLFLLKGYNMFRKYKARVRIKTVRSDDKAYFML